MGYLFLAIALLCGCTKGYCGKKTSGAVKELRDAMLANIVRMLFCVVVGFAVLALQGEVSRLRVDSNTLLIAAFSGIATAMFVVLWLVEVKKGAYMMINVFLLLGSIFPIAVSTVLFGESIKINQIIGFVVLTAAVIVMCSYSNSVKEKMSLTSFILLFLCGLANGAAALSQKLFVVYVKDGSNAVFNLYTYVFSAIVLAACYLLFGIKGTRQSKNVFSNNKALFCYICVMALCLFLYSYFMTMAAAYLPAVILYPLSQGAGLILSSLMAALFFKEKITKTCMLGLILAFAGLIVMNML